MQAHYFLIIATKQNTLYLRSMFFFVFAVLYLLQINLFPKRNLDDPKPLLCTIRPGRAFPRILGRNVRRGSVLVVTASRDTRDTGAFSLIRFEKLPGARPKDIRIHVDRMALVTHNGTIAISGRIAGALHLIMCSTRKDLPSRARYVFYERHQDRILFPQVDGREDGGWEGISSININPAMEERHRVL